MPGQRYLLAAVLLLLLPHVLVASPAGKIIYEYDDEPDTHLDKSLPPVTIKATRDFESLGKQAAANKQIILLEMTATHCEYCILLEEEVLKPMLRSGYYKGKVLIRQLKIDSNLDIIDFDGRRNSPGRFSSRYRVYVTPTLLILDENGKEIAERIIGVQSLDFYAHYVDRALDRGLTGKGRRLQIPDD